jgi:TetR/AcrR family transcriptional repressor of nem operon
MKVSKETAARHREALLAAAGQLFREKGFDKVGIAEIAAAADLTHGAFYTHFASKAELCAEVLASLVGQSADMLAATGDWRTYVESYLSAKHVHHRGNGCPLAALGGDVARENASLKTAFATGLERSIEAFAGVIEQQGAVSSRGRAIFAVAAMAGALTLARSVSPELRDEILQVVKASLTGRSTTHGIT